MNGDCRTLDEIYASLDAEQRQCVGSYADNSWTYQLVSFLDDEQELSRLNDWRNESHDILWLNETIKAAIELRHHTDKPS